jgi:Polyketide cyclase / dehydrase and lipid transport
VTIVMRTFAVTASPAAVLEYVKDFGNTRDRAVTRHDDGPVTVGSSWQHESRIRGRPAELTYSLTELGPDRVVFVGRSENATSIEVVTVRPAAGGSEVTYRADLEMHGLAKLATPVMRSEFEKLADETAARLTAALNDLASAA